MIITPCSRARRRELTVRVALETDGLTVVSAHLSNVAVDRPCPVLGARSPPTRI
jgi:hypothetical protein